MKNFSILTIGLILSLVVSSGCVEPEPPEPEVKVVEEKQLTTHTAWDEFSAWSPDGRKIAFVSDRTGNEDIWVMDSDGGNLRQLTTHTADDEWFAWSPDGRKIAFMSERTGNVDIWVLILE